MKNIIYLFALKLVNFIILTMFTINFMNIINKFSNILISFII